MKLLAAFVLCIVTAAYAFGADSPPYSLTVDFSAKYAPAVEIYQANERVFDVSLVNRGTLSLTNLTPAMWWATYAGATQIVLAAISNVNTSNGTFRATFTPSQLNTNGTFIYGVSATGTGPTTARQGQFVLKPDPWATGASAISFSQSINWALYSYIGGLSGPYLAGTNVTARLAPNGAVYFDAALPEGSGISSSDATNIVSGLAYPLTGNPSNFCTLAAAASLTNNLAPRSWVSGFSNCPASYNSDFRTVDITLPDGVTGQLFQEAHVVVQNNTGAIISNGAVVHLSQASGFNTAAQLASNTNIFDKCFSTLGFATHDIAIGAIGKITTFGNVNELNTTGFAEGTNIWLGVTPGTYQAFMPTNSGEHRVALGMVTREHQNQGRIYVRVQYLPDATDVGAYPLSSNPSNYCTIFAATNGLGGYSVTNHNHSTLYDALGAAAARVSTSGVTSIIYSNPGDFASSGALSGYMPTGSAHSALSSILGAGSLHVSATETGLIHTALQPSGVRFWGDDGVEANVKLLLNLNRADTNQNVGSEGIGFIGNLYTGSTYTNILYLSGYGAGFMRAVGLDANNWYTMYDSGNFIAGTHYLSPSGSASGLSGCSQGASPTNHNHAADYYPLASGQAASNLAAAAATPAQATNTALAVWASSNTVGNLVGLGAVTGTPWTAQGYINAATATNIANAQIGSLTNGKASGTNMTGSIFVNGLVSQVGTNAPWAAMGYLTNLSGAVTNVVFTNAAPSVSSYASGVLLIGTNTPIGGITNIVAATNNLGYVTNINSTAYIGTGIVSVAGVITNNQTGVTLSGTFNGNLSGATNIPLSGLQIAPITNNQTGVSLSGTFTGNGASLTNIPLSGLQIQPLTNNQGAVTFTGTLTASNLTVNGITTHSKNVAITGSADTNQLRIVGNAVQSNPILAVYDSGLANLLFSIDNSGNIFEKGNSTNTGLTVNGNANVTNTLTAATLINQGMTNLNYVYVPVYTNVASSLTNYTIRTSNGSEQCIVATSNSLYITSEVLSANRAGLIGLYVDCGTNAVTWDTNVFNSSAWPVFSTNGADVVLRKCFGSTMWTVNGPTTGWSGSVTNSLGAITNITVYVGGMVTTNMVLQ